MSLSARDVMPFVERSIRFTGWGPNGPCQVRGDLTPQGNISGHTIAELKTSLSKSQVAVLCTRHNGIDLYRRFLADLVGISQFPWTDLWEKSNGYFNCEVARDKDGAVSDITTSTLFETKRIIPGGRAYCWVKFNFITFWIASSKQMRILVLEGPTDFEDDMHQVVSCGLGEETLRDPFWPFELALKDVVRTLERSIWAVRDEVRAVETTEMPVQEKPNPDYRHLHNLARHAIHVNETLEVSTNTIDTIIRHYEDIYQRDVKTQDRYYNNLHGRLRFFSSILCGLKHRSEANRQRLLNEIKLAIHTVSQYDSSTSVEITQSDSCAMKTVAFVTLTFFPATIVSSIFSMSFFDFSPAAADTWVLSDKFWLYWAFTVPLTIITSALCVYLQIVPSLEFGIGNQRRRKASVCRHSIELKALDSSLGA